MGETRNDQENTNPILEAFGNTSICTFMYYPQEKKIIIPDKTCKRYQCNSVYENMPYSFVESFVDQNDYAEFKRMYFQIDHGEPYAFAEFHSKDFKYFCRVTLTTISWTNSKKPKETFGIIEDVSEVYQSEQLVKQIHSQLVTQSYESETKEALYMIGTSIGGQYYAIYHIWVDTRSYVCFQEKLPGILSLIGIKGEYDPAWNTYIENYVEQEDKKKMFEFSNLELLKKKLKNSNSIMRVYRRKGIGWTRGKFIVAKRDPEGNVLNMIYTVEDINDEMSQELKQNQIIYESQHDSLTGVLNRNGFEKVLAGIKQKNIGFGIVDIDNFKSLNDTHGHEMGDIVLKEISQLLKNLFRNKSIVSRLGGDELGILFIDYTDDEWDLICRKIKTIHSTIAETLPNGISCTISIGLCVSNDGYIDKMSILADKALYETKRNGKAGCTLINMKGIILKHWRDDTLSLHSQNALDYNNTGLFRLECINNKKPRLLCNETAKLLLGLDDETSPEECYEAWIKGIHPSYYDVLMKMKQEMIASGQAECTYLWNHPKYGNIYVRTGGYGEYTKNGEVLYGYHHSLRDTKIMEKEDDSRLIISALNRIYFCSYYVDLEHNTYSTFKMADGEKMLEKQNSLATNDIVNFINSFVHPEDKKKMKEFMDLGTLPERLKNEKYIDAEYRSILRKEWCRASFFPVKYDEFGNLTHVLFEIASLDANKVFEIEKNIQNKKSIESLYDSVPGGIVMYEWDGKQLKTLHISKYYEKQYGYSLVSNQEGSKGGPDFLRIHPDDREEYKAAILEELMHTHHLTYIYRVWNQELNRYVWVKLNAVAEPQSDGTSLVYAMYSDITEQKDIEQTLQKNRASLSAALSASNQLCYEYDPLLHLGECYTDTNFFNLPKRIENYPDSLRNFDLFHKDDENTFIETAHKMDHGDASAHCDVRIKKNGKYEWYSCIFSAYYDAEKERNVAILTVVDISLRIASLNDYDERVRSLLNMNEESICIGHYNLTKNIYTNLKSIDSMKKFINDSLPFDGQILNASYSVLGDEDQKKYREMFNRKYLLEQVQKGNFHVRLKHFFKINENHIEWVETAVDMIINPVTGEIIGVCYAKNIQSSEFSSLLLKKTIQQDYPMISIVYKDTDEFYLYDAKKNRYGEYKKNFWKVIVKALYPIALNYSFEEIQNAFKKENVIDALDKSQECSYSFDSNYSGKLTRLELKFSYLDKEHRLILSTLRNITDSMLIEKLRYDNEHDTLTGLYNRKKTFSNCKELLNQYPNVLFGMLHFDIKHFQLYNSFFGDKIGDRLLCDISDIIRKLKNEYEYCAYGRIVADVFCIFFPYNKEKYERQLNYIFNVLQNYRDDFLVEPSIGLYLVTNKNLPIESMFTRATIAAKSQHANILDKSIYFTEKMEQKLHEEQQVLQDMQIALENEQFEIYLQPKYSLRTNKPVGAEALVRWVHPTKGMISPSIFIPVFEKNGFVATLDRYMWEHTCILLQKWMKEGKKISPISVNVSRFSIFSPTTVQFLKSLVEKYNIPPKYLELELTETAYMDDQNKIKIHLMELQEYGFKILMDDFGSGYSSLNTLKDLPVDCLKLDMNFFSDSYNERRGRLVITSIMQMSKLLGLTVIAEGVEEKDQADFLRSVGCEYVQGFLYSKPIPVEEYEKLCISQESYHEYKLDEMENLDQLLTDTKVSISTLGHLFPIPLAVIEFKDNNFVVLRANKIFISEFGLEEDYSPVSKVFKTHLSEEEHQNVMDVYTKCTNEKETVNYEFTWNEKDGKKIEFYGKVAYEGKIGDRYILFTTLIKKVK